MINRQPPPLSLDQIRRYAPSVFAETPWGNMSDRYAFVPTIAVVERLQAEGWQPMKATQGRTRIPGKGEFTRHCLRFARPDSAILPEVGMIRPEIILQNSHDGTSCFEFSGGLFRLVCLNGLTLPAGLSESVKVKHSGDLSPVIEGVYEVVEDLPLAVETVQHMQQIQVSERQQIAFATAAAELRSSTIEIEPRTLLKPRRWEDNANDLFTTMNRVQENMIKGGVAGRDVNNRRRRTRAVASIQEDARINKALFTLALEMGKILEAA